MYYLYGVLDYDLESDDLVGVIRSCFVDLVNVMKLVELNLELGDSVKVDNLLLNKSLLLDYFLPVLFKKFFNLRFGSFRFKLVDGFFVLKCPFWFGGFGSYEWFVLDGALEGLEFVCVGVDGLSVKDLNSI